MVILCDGMVRSGSTWSFNVALQLLKSCDPNRKAFGTYSDNPAVLAAAIRPRFSNLVIKSHSLDPVARGLCDKGAVKAIYTWREPRDVVASCMQMFGSSAPHATGILRKALRIWAFHRATSSACIVSYEEITKDPCAAIERIADYLGLTIDSEQLRGIADEVSFERVKRFSQHLSELEPSRQIRSNGHFFDRVTLFHKDHIRNGGIGYGARLLGHLHLDEIDAVLREEGFGFLCQSLCVAPANGELVTSPKLSSPAGRSSSEQLPNRCDEPLGEEARTGRRIELQT
jgi:Sulfotransferase domain